MGAANRDGSVAVADLVATGIFAVDSNERLSPGGSYSANGDVTINSDSDVSGAGDIVFQSGGTEMGRIPNAALSGSGAQYGPGALLFGNDALSNYGPNHGTPAGNVMPIRFQVVKGTPGVDLGQTHQGGVAWTKYKTRTIDDAAQSWSFGVIITDAYGAFPGAQTQAVTGNESDALVQGAVVVNAKVVGHVAAVQIQDTAHADTIINFYSAQSTVAAGATVTNRYGFFDEALAGTAPTNAWTLKGQYTIQTTGKLVIGTTTTDATLTRAIIFGTSTDSVGTLTIQQGSGQTSASLTVRDSGGVQRGQWFGQTGNLLIGNTATGGGGSGMISIATATVPSGTPPAAGFYLYIDPADNKLKAKGTSGTITVLALP